MDPGENSGNPKHKAFGLASCLKAGGAQKLNLKLKIARNPLKFHIRIIFLQRLHETV
jgi:hypothetical protein